ncbi:hypothetical protein [Streptomyces sp. ALB3]|uniref:hypothetical protein n=1 Tax=Streptomyces sp. ALB3 TaxID=3374278 RepID=UPI00379FBB29
MTDVLTWTVQQRLELEERAGVLRKELDDVEGRLARLEAAEAGFGEWADAVHPPRDRPPVGPPRPRQHRSPAVTNDLAAMITLLTGTSQSVPPHANPVTCGFRMKRSRSH